MRTRAIFAAFAAIAAAVPVAAMGAADTPSGVPVVNSPVSVRQMGMGDVAICGNDVMRMTANPAVLADMDMNAEVAANGGPMAGGFQTSFAFGGGWRFMPSWAAGLSFSGVQASFDEVNALGEKGGKIDQMVTVMGLAVAGSWRWLRAGIGIKGIGESLIGDRRDTQAVDAGLLASWRDFTFGLSACNLAFGMLWDPPEGIEPLNGWQAGGGVPSRFRLGVGYNYQPWNLAGALEMRAGRDLDGPHGGAGLEWWATRAFGMRLGFIAVEKTLKEKVSVTGLSPSLTAGLSGIISGVGVDYALASGQLGFSHRFSISYGFLGAKPAVEEAAPAEQSAAPRQEAPAREEAQVPVKPGAAKLNVAIADLRAENVSAGDSAVMADLLRNELVKTRAFNVIEKQNMDKVLAEHAFQQTGCSSEECAVKLGKLLNVQRMAVGSFGKLMDSYILSIRVVNVETGAIDFADSAEGEKVSDLRTGVKDLAARMAKQIR